MVITWKCDHPAGWLGGCDDTGRYVKAIVRLLLNHDELLLEGGARTRVGSEGGPVTRLYASSSPGSDTTTTTTATMCPSQPLTPVGSIHTPSPGGPLSIDYEFEEEYV